MRAYIADLKTRLRPSANPYLEALRAGDSAMSREDFIETQLQFLFAVVFFSRPMAALAGRMPRPERRMSLLANVADEHGDGDLSLCHERTFLLLLSRLGVTPAIEHADGFYRLLDQPYAAAPRRAYQIQQGLELGAYLLLRLYQDLYAARGRRWNRQVGGPHSLAEGWYLEAPAATSK